MKLLFVYNPHSGVGRIKSQLSDILDIMVRAGYEVSVHPTQAVGDATEVTAARAADYDLVVCCGGDGTLDETVTGLMQSGSEVPLGYIPSGSTNDFAASLKLPKNMKKAAEVAVNGIDFKCDVGCFGEKNFIYIAAFGLFTDVSYQTKQELKNVLGHVAYILEGAKRIGSHPSYRMRVEYDGGVIEDEFMYGMVTNSLSVGGFKGMTGDDVALDDGLFEVMLIRTPRNAVELNEIIAALTKLRPESDLIYTFKTDELQISPYQAIPWTLDGEYGGEQTQIRLKSMRRALTIRVPGEK
ncbi:MAG: YegS/Rv2252/BmrU family lipid kinase [Eubacterium sp.]|nr:YegS/Rv2252/BmrU family lipid kinase [Eubacterium sp.]